VKKIVNKCAIIFSKYYCILVLENSLLAKSEQPNFDGLNPGHKNLNLINDA